MSRGRKARPEVPNLRRFVTEGSYAAGVVGVLPTLTYPSHTTLITGTAPSRHGIVNNTTYDPMQINRGGWFWYAGDNKARTLWDAARDAGLTTANVHWPVSVAAKNVTWNLPQYWVHGPPRRPKAAGRALHAGPHPGTRSGSGHALRRRQGRRPARRRNPRALRRRHNRKAPARFHD